MIPQTILNTHDVREITNYLVQHWGLKQKDAKLNYVYLTNKKNKLFLMSRGLGKLVESDDLQNQNLRVERVGTYFGEQTDSGLRLTIEGSALIGLLATKNVIEITNDELKEWWAGKNIVKELDTKKEEVTEEGYLIVSYRNPKTKKLDFLGSGRYKSINGTWQILNYVPKIRRIQKQELLGERKEVEVMGEGALETLGEGSKE